MKENLTEYQFSYEVKKEQKVFIYWYNRQVMIVKGKQAVRLIDRLETATPDEAELILAKITGNFKRGNEKDNK